MLTMMKFACLVLVASLACTGDGSGSDCLASGMTCSGSTANPSGGCCSETCEARGTTSVCTCLATDARCTAPGQCCSGSCSGGRCQCLATGPGGTGEQCTSSDQCCNDGLCIGGRCTCRNRGETCTQQECCGSLTCGSGAGPGGSAGCI